MSVVWAFIKDDKGYVFGDGNITSEVIINGCKQTVIEQENFKKVFKIILNNNTELIGGFTGQMYMFYKRIDCHFEDCFKDKEITNDESIKNAILDYFNDKAKEIGKETKWEFYSLIITSSKAIYKVSFDFNEEIKFNECKIKMICSKNDTIGDYPTLRYREKIFKSILEGNPKKLSQYLQCFNEVKNEVCTPKLVGGSTTFETIL